jgi:hypothetical protein
VHGTRGIDSPESLAFSPGPKKGGRRGPLLTGKGHRGVRVKLQIDRTSARPTFHLSTIIKTRKGRKERVWKIRTNETF